jgi:hypothetical protein
MQDTDRKAIKALKKKCERYYCPKKDEYSLPEAQNIRIACIAILAGKAYFSLKRVTDNSIVFVLAGNEFIYSLPKRKKNMQSKMFLEGMQK